MGVEMILSLGRVDDFGWVYVNGKIIGKTTDWSHAYSFEVTKSLHPGHNVIAVVVQNEGGGGGIGNLSWRRCQKTRRCPWNRLGDRRATKCVVEP